MPKTKTQDLFKLLWHQTLSDYVTAIAWSPDGTYLASGNNDRSVLVWE
ncbi:MAG: WD40 repeat domain-containing protein, partial [Cyanobacteria bacterium J06659_2]